MIVVIIASILRLSQTIPTMPTIKAAGNEKIISSPPRAARGLPQPGLSIISAHIVTAAMPNKIAEIFPKRIVNSPKNTKYKFQYFDYINH